MRRGRRAYILLAWTLLACILVQVFLAGLGTFVSGEHWASHRAFVHVFELVPIVLFALSFPARLRGFPRWLPVVVFALIALQYATVEARPSVLAALHPVNAVLMAWAAFRMARTDISVVIAK
jgi:mercuric ion transport protein